MNLSLKIARRYLFAKKSTNAINIISGIAVTGIVFGTVALILVLSVFNGFGEILQKMFSQFNPDIKITPKKGKTFEEDSTTLTALLHIDGVQFVSRTLEEVAVFQYKNGQDFGIIKGVDEFYNKVNGIDSTIVEGEYYLKKDGINYAVFGAGMRSKLSIDVDNKLTPVSIYMAKKKKVGALGKPFRKKTLYAAGTFRVNQDFDNDYVLASLEFTRKLLKTKKGLSSLEVKIRPNVNHDEVQAAIEKLLGDKFAVKNRYQQEEAFLKLMNIEKWISFAILSLMLLLIAFNLVGSLWMIAMEKKSDIAILKSMGAPDKTIQRIFINQGLLLSLLGLLIGFFLAIIIYYIQINFGIVSIPPGFIIDYYPVKLKLIDFAAVSFIVIAIGYLASIAPARMAKQTPSIIRAE